MDPNLRTLSLAAWMSLPGLDFNEWDRHRHSINDNNNSDQQQQEQQKGTCPKCDTLKAKNKTNNVQLVVKKQKKNNNNENNNINNNNNVEVLCSKCLTAHKKSSGLPSPEQQIQVKGNPAIERTVATVPRRNLSLQRLQSREVETRALISQVAEYYEDYVTAMGLDKYFLNNAIVTNVSPIKMSQENFNGKFKNAKWIVSG